MPGQRLAMKGIRERASYPHPSFGALREGRVNRPGKKERKGASEKEKRAKKEKIYG